MINIKCQRFEDGEERGRPIFHLKSPEEALGFLFDVDLRWGCRFTLVSEKELITSTGMMGVTDVTTYSGTKEEMATLYRTAETFEFVKSTKNERNTIAYEKAVNRIIHHIPSNKNCNAIRGAMRQLFAGISVVRVVCLLMISNMNVFTDDVNLDDIKNNDMVSILQLVLFHKARIQDLV